ncbi:ATP-binding protein [Paenibacillus sp. DYY-L-2]|uniref:ATP-binding protein n=1 Tax=Paenibacillus sp. DYY-L-2 TaxID=3447013 RepID=UPI003F50C1D1
MKAFLKAVAVCLILMVIIFFVIFLEGPNDRRTDEQTIDHWQMIWTNKFDPTTSEKQLEQMEGWENTGIPNKNLSRPEGAKGLWVKIELPQNIKPHFAILFDKIYGREIVILNNENVLYKLKRDYNFETNTVLIPLDSNYSGETLYIGIGSEGRFGIQDSVRVGDYQQLIKGFVRVNITDFILGCTLIFIAAIMLICIFFLKNENLATWLSLCIVILSSGVMVITYSPYSYWLFENAGKIYVNLFDISLFVLLPAFTYFFEKIFGPGYFSLIKNFRKFQIIYSGVCLLVTVTYAIQPESMNLYRFVTGQLLGYFMILQFVLLICTALIYAIKGNPDGIIFSVGFIIFAFLGLGELIWYYFKEAYYDLYLWKWGVIFFLTALIVILGRKFAQNHERVVEYSKQLEMFNNELQRSEKMEIISELAASVAHEVRNPLQVTRGFLQLLAAKQNSADKVYLSMALEELDRASGIITDFLTFAKPEVGKVATLNILDEFLHIEGILVPMANLQGGKISVHIPKDLYIKGNSSKFKQASINIIKNSIEALHGEGEIQVWAYEKDDHVYIHIKDTGEGMDPEVLERLGEPYFSNKTKGTGLGLMVTFRIIEVMNGTLSFKSQKGAGTEATISFPSVKP